MSVTNEIQKYLKYLWLMILILMDLNINFALARENQVKTNQIQIQPVDEFNLNSHHFSPDSPEPGQWKLLSKPSNAIARLEKINATESRVKFINHATGNYRFQFQSVSDKIDTIQIFYGLKSRFTTNEAFFNSPAIASDGTYYLSSERSVGFGSIWHFAADGTSHSFVTDTKYSTRSFADVPILTPEGKLFGLMSRSIDDPPFSSFYLEAPEGMVRPDNPYPELKTYSYHIPALRDDGIFYSAVSGTIDYSYSLVIYAILASRIKISNTQSEIVAYDWVHKLDSKFSTQVHTVISIDGTIYTSTGSFFYAINPDSTLKWKYPLTSEVTTVPAVDNAGTLYFGAANYQLYAITPDGNLKWTFPAEREIYSSPAIDVDGTIYFGSSDWYLYALNADGTLKWKTLTSGPILSSPAIARDGSVYVGSNDRRLYAFSAAGEVLWYVDTEFQLESSPAIADDGTVIFCDGNRKDISPGGFYRKYENKGNIYLIATQNGGLARSPWPKYRHDNRNTSCAMNKLTTVESQSETNENPAETIWLATFPNPFNSGTTIRFQIPPQQTGDLKLLIYNVLGEEVQRFDLNASLEKEINWDGTNHQNQLVASGTYLVILTNGIWRQSAKLVYLK